MRFIAPLGQTIQGSAESGEGVESLHGQGASAPLTQVENDEPQPQVVLAFGLRITNCEPTEVLGVVDLGAGEVLQRQRIDQQRHAVALHRKVVLGLGLIEGEAVLEPRASAAADIHAQLQRRVAFFGNQLVDLVRGGCR